MSGNKPFLLKAAYKDYIWGGTRLREDYGQDLECTCDDRLAEAWVCSTHKDGCSEIIGEQNVFLSDILKKHPEYLGTHASSVTDGKGDLPILVKLIDAKEDLSIQVHPNDEYAKINENGQRGKTELWYVLHAKKGARIVYGFRHDMTGAKIRRAIEDGSIEKHMLSIPVHKDDVFVVEPGTIHAIGEGIVIAEIQESSNLTYRLYDYDRTDKDGKKRSLHIEKALDVVNSSAMTAPRQPMRLLKYKNGFASELLGRCKYFQVERLLINTEQSRNMAEYKSMDNSFKVLLCVDGCGTLLGKDFMISFFKGDCIFVPANSIPMKIHGRAQILSVGC